MNSIRLFPSIFALFFLLSFSVQAQETISYKTETNLLYRENDGLTDYMNERCRLDVYYPVGKKDFATIVWFHGGGITGGEKFIPDRWKEQGFAVVAVNYRLSPQVKSPAYIEDAAAAVAWVFRHIEEFGGSAEKIVVSGHSAGGYLASMVGLDKQYLAAFGVDADRIAALVPFSGHTITHFTIRDERGIPGTQPVVDALAPLFHVRPDAPPLYLITGGRELEMLGRYEENAYMYRMMKVAGHQQTYLYELDGFDHGGMAAPAFDLTLRILKERGLN
ncbi:alpha/beta hydrolase [Gaoshiqia sediminis]|uniref:Alpha/beta hydrolase n=1 Tax=Gaoshiqia sediminis TaxID=2986998 RepID=A0AA41Y582_9BACT|nr:alpha/beta hydrolase [Gaoshiqia sediminis]MCW0481342.1 alpha/beta hydrolase [Gaoshiqia sediminis]